jgi:Secretion system C-terminal sorting domain/Matrixin/IPT/TIG domain
MKKQLLFILLAITHVAYSQLTEVPFNNQVDEAQLIIEGTIVNQTSFYASGTEIIYTAHEIDVLKILKGEPAQISNENKIYLINVGGTIGTNHLEVEPNVQLNNEESATFILNPDIVGVAGIGLPQAFSYNVTQNAQSKYTYNCGPGQVIGLFTSFENPEAFYSAIEQLTGTPTITVSDANPCDPTDMPQAITITGLSPASVPGGVQGALTITGTGFGATQGGSKVWFRKNNNPNQFVTSNNFQVVSWSDTQIEIYVPDIAGTGQIGVSPSAFASPTYSSGALIVPYAEININYRQTQHVADQTTFNIPFYTTTAFGQNTDATFAMREAFAQYFCPTSFNSELNIGNAQDITNANGENVVRFDPALPAGVLGVCYSYYGTCGGDYYVAEMDLAFNPNKNWNFTQNPPTATQYDFQSVATHELGHARQLRHIIDPSVVMYFSLGAGTQKRQLNNDEIWAGNDINMRSENGICGRGYIGISCGPNLSIEDPDITKLTIYPNPASEILYITNLSINTANFSILDIQGKVLKKGSLSNGLVSILELAQGVYFIKISEENKHTIKKFIKE